MEINDLECAILFALKDQAGHPSLSQLRALIVEPELSPSPSQSELFPCVESLISKGIVERNLIETSKHKTFAGLYLTREGYEVAEALTVEDDGEYAT